MLAVQVSQTLNPSNLSDDVTSIAGLKMQRLSLDNIREHVQDFVDGRVRRVLIKRLQKSEMHALQFQDDVSAIEGIGVVSRRSGAKQVAGVGLRARATNSENKNANILQLLWRGIWGRRAGIRG
jgi:hypothetical protein